MGQLIGEVLMKRIIVCILIVCFALCLNGCILNADEAEKNNAIKIFIDNKSEFGLAVQVFDDNKEKFSPWPWLADLYLMLPSEKLQEAGIEGIFQVSEQHKEVLEFRLKRRKNAVVEQGLIYMPQGVQSFENYVITEIEDPWYYYYIKN